VSGTIGNSNESVGVIQFYNSLGTYLKALRVPGSVSVGPVCWKGNGLKIGLGVGSAMFLGNIKQDYKMVYLSKADTFVFAVEKEDRIEYCLVFYNCARRTRRMKFLRQLYAIRSFGELCLVVTKVEDADNTYLLSLCNSIGTPLE
jgi:WD repeat-containing protein 35